VTTQAAVVLEPPKGGPRKDEIVGAGLRNRSSSRIAVSSSSALPNIGPLVPETARRAGRSAPLVRGPLIIVHQDEGAAGRNGLDDFLNRELPTGAPITPRRNRNFRGVPASRRPRESSAGASAFLACRRAAKLRSELFKPR